MTEEQIYNLINRHLAGDTSPDEERRLQDWLDESGENQRIYEEVRSALGKVAAPQPEQIPPFETFWARLEGKLDPELASTPARTIPLRPRAPLAILRQPRWLAAAALLIVVLGGTFIYQQFIAAGTVTYVTKNAEQLPVTLPDGSRVHLNVDSRLVVYTGDFREHRNVALSGQAFFEVERTGVPFVVKTDNAEVRVLGTAFDVRARNRRTRVMVREGRVSLSSTAASEEQTVLLTANLMSFVDGSNRPVAPMPADSGNVAAWQRQTLVFDDMPLAEIVAELERVYDVEITVVDPSLRTVAVTATFEQQSVTDILASLCLLLNMNYTGSEGTYVISR